MESSQKKINSLLKKMLFKVDSILKVPKIIRIFNSHVIDKIKNIRTLNAFEKSRLVVQVYNDYSKMAILIPSPII